MTDNYLNELINKCLSDLYKEAFPSSEYNPNLEYTKYYLPNFVLNNIIDNYIDQYNIPQKVKDKFEFGVLDKAPCCDITIVKTYNKNLTFPDISYWKCPK